MSYLSIAWPFWMWLVAAVFWLLPAAGRWYFLIGATLLFLAIYSPQSAGLIVAFTAVTWLANRRPVASGLELTAGGLVMAIVLIAYKLNLTGAAVANPTDILIPLGLSYYTFRCLHVLVERYKSALPPLSIWELTRYLLFLPTILVGPINRYGEFRRDINRHRFDWANVSLGVERILFGYVKIAFLSNLLVGQVFGSIVDAQVPDSQAYYYLLTVKHGLNIYLQFSGFSDIAIGFALILGFRIQENFNWPYLQPNIQAFWASWHMSLSQWCRDYIYKLVLAHTRQVWLATIATMTIIGLWHEISPRYLYWGLYHAAGIVIYQATKGFFLARQQAEATIFSLPLLIWPRGVLGRVLGVIVTVHFVWFSFIILWSRDLGDAARIFGILLTGG